MRPDRLIVVLGTATEIGKTWVTARVAAELRSRGVPVAARKPAQSFEPGDDLTDAQVLASATGEEPESVCPPHRHYAVPMAPPMAAEALGRPSFTVAELVAEISWPPDVAVGFVEAVGGPCSPIAADGDGLDLVEALDPDLVLLVADAGLGTINAVELTRRVLGAHPLLVVLNRYDDGDDLHRRNRRWLQDVIGVAVVIDPGEVADRLSVS